MLKELQGGDGYMNVGSTSIALSAAMRTLLIRRIVAGAVGDDLAKRYAWSGSGSFLDYVITTQPREWLPRGFDSYQALLLTTYEEAVEFLTKRLGTDRSHWTWGRLAQVRFQHPLASLPSIAKMFKLGAIPQTGGEYTVNRGSLVSMRYIADLSNWDNSREGITLGESGDPQSSHWKDQLTSWRTVQPPSFPFSAKAVTSATKETLYLVPSTATGRSSTAPTKP